MTLGHLECLLFYGPTCVLTPAYAGLRCQRFLQKPCGACHQSNDGLPEQEKQTNRLRGCLRELTRKMGSSFGCVNVAEERDDPGASIPPGLPSLFVQPLPPLRDGGGDCEGIYDDNWRRRCKGAIPMAG